MAEAPLFRLPNELIYNILGYLPPQDLALLSTTCRVLYHHASDDRLWQAIVQDNVPGIDVASAPLPQSITSFRDLFLTHHPHWFLSRFKIWIGSESMAGKLMVAVYDPRRASIEGYQLLAVKKEGLADVPPIRALDEHDLFLDPSDAAHSHNQQNQQNAQNTQNQQNAQNTQNNQNAQNAQNAQTIQVYSFEPDIHLHIDRPIVKLEPWLTAPVDGQGLYTDTGPWFTEEVQECPRPARPPDRTVPISSLNENEIRSIYPDPESSSEWVWPITMESGTLENVSRVASQFVYARTLPHADARRDGSFALTKSIHTKYSTAIPLELVQLTHGWDPPFHPAAAMPFVLVPPRVTWTPDDPPHFHLPYGVYRVWPPPNVPTAIPGSTAEHRVRCVMHSERGRTSYLRDEDKPYRVAQVSDRVFHVRSWIEPIQEATMQLRRYTFSPEGGGDVFLDSPLARYTHMQSFATVDPFYYTPTADKPFRGIWVGDYGGHGCEFLLIHQPDHEQDTTTDDDDIGPQLDTESDAEYAARRQDGRIYRGSLHAIKLTGDPNVPRGEYSFVVADLGAGRVIRKGLFAGARMVASEGHVAGHGFRNDRFVASRLIIISPDRLAQYWSGSGYISYFHRVDIDRFTRPY